MHVDDPALMKSRFDPSPWMLERIELEVPCPTAIRVITAPTPITTPRMVKRLLSLWVMIPPQAEATGSKIFFISIPFQKLDSAVLP